MLGVSGLFYDGPVFELDAGDAASFFGSFVPGYADYLDNQIIRDPNESAFAVLSATLSQLANVASGGIAPNFSTLRKLFGKLAGSAEDVVGAGRGGVHGTLVHTEFEKLVKGANLPGVSTEVSFKDGVLVGRGTPGSIRLDVVKFGPGGAVEAVWDLKTGGSTLSPARVEQIYSHLPLGARPPIGIIRP